MWMVLNISHKRRTQKLNILIQGYDLWKLLAFGA